MLPVQRQNMYMSREHHDHMHLVEAQSKVNGSQHRDLECQFSNCLRMTPDEG